MFHLHIFFDNVFYCGEDLLEVCEPFGAGGAGGEGDNGGANDSDEEYLRMKKVCFAYFSKSLKLLPKCLLQNSVQSFQLN